MKWMENGQQVQDVAINCKKYLKADKFSVKRDESSKLIYGIEYSLYKIKTNIMVANKASLFFAHDNLIKN